MTQLTRAARVLFPILSFALFVPAALAQKSAVVATVDGKAITEEDVRAAAADEFVSMENQQARERHDLLQAQLDEVVEKRLLEAESKARGVTVEAVLAEIKTAAVTDAEVDAFYEENKAQIPRPKEQVAAQIRQYLSQQREAEARTTFFDALKAKHKVRVQLEPFRTAVTAAGPAFGPVSAPVTIVEFSDFQCPFCSRNQPTLQQIRSKYGDKVRFVFRQFPLNIHDKAPKAAEASLCASEQGKFWEMHDAMFADQKKLAIDDLKATAAVLKLDPAKFSACLDSGKYASQVQADLSEGRRVGVSGTPAMFVNGRFINGAVPVEQVTQVIDEELQRTGTK